MTRLMERPGAHWFWRRLIRGPLPEPAYYWLLDRLTNNNGWRPLFYRANEATTCGAQVDDAIAATWSCRRCGAATGDACPLEGADRESP